MKKLIYTTIFVLTFQLSALAADLVDAETLALIKQKITTLGVKVERISASRWPTPIEAYDVRYVLAQVEVVNEFGKKITLPVTVSIGGEPVRSESVARLFVNKYMRAYYFSVDHPNGKGPMDVNEVLEKSLKEIETRIIELKQTETTVMDERLRPGRYIEAAILRKVYIAFGVMETVQKFTGSKTQFFASTNLTDLHEERYRLKDLETLERLKEGVSAQVDKLNTELKDLETGGKASSSKATKIKTNLMDLANFRASIELLEKSLRDISELQKVQHLGDREIREYEAAQVKADLKEVEAGKSMLKLVSDIAGKDNNAARWKTVAAAVDRLSGIMQRTGALSGLSHKILYFGAQLAALEHAVDNAVKLGGIPEAEALEITRRSLEINRQVRAFRAEAVYMEASKVVGRGDLRAKFVPSLELTLLAEQIKMADAVLESGRSIKIKR